MMSAGPRCRGLIFTEGGNESCDQSLVVRDIVFATHQDRALYLGTSLRNRTRWLQDNTGKWRRFGDAEEKGVAQQALAVGEITIGARRYANAPRVASLLGVSLRTLSRWDRSGTGPPKIKIGRKVFFDVDKILEWLAAQETPPARDAGQTKRKLP
jgi:predicted DNA-binding transcriptional regulator AlpA